MQSALLATAFSGSQFQLSQAQNKERAPRERQLNLYSWADYFDPATVPEFEKRYGVKVVVDTFASNEALLAKLQAGGSNYDVLVPSGYMVAQLIEMNLLAELDRDRIIGLNRIMPRFRDARFDPGLKHTVPYFWGTTGIGFNQRVAADILAERSPSRVLSKMATLERFWDDRFAGRMTLLDDLRETIGMALKRRGHSYNSTSEAEIKEAVDDLKRQKQLDLCYTSDQIIVQLTSGDSWISHAFNGDTYQARKENGDVAYAIPVEGGSLWLDSVCLSKSCSNPDLAYKWISFVLEPKIAAANSIFTRYATPNQEALPLVPLQLREDVNLYPSDKVLDKCDQLRDLGSAIKLYDRLWTELKCS